MHKDEKDWSRPYEIPPGRLIISDCGSESYHTVKYIEYFLKPLAQKHLSYLKDS